MKKKTNIYIKIYLLIVFVIGITIFFSMKARPVSGTWIEDNLMSGITIGYSNTSKNTYKLVGTSNLYCIYKGGTLRSDRTNTYYARYKIVIEGRTATIYKNNDGAWEKKRFNNKFD